MNISRIVGSVSGPRLVRALWGLALGPGSEPHWALNDRFGDAATLSYDQLIPPSNYTRSGTVRCMS